MNMNMLGQILGLVAFALSVATYQQNTHKRIVLMQLLANICFTLHFYLLDAYTGALLNAVGIARCIVYICKHQKWAASNLWIIFFSLLCVTACACTWEGYLSLLPACAMVFTTVAFGVDKPALTRFFSLPSSPLWLIYGIITHSWGSVLTECFNIISIVIGMLRFDRKKQAQA